MAISQHIRIFGHYGVLRVFPSCGFVGGRVVADCPAPDTGLLGVVVDAFEVGIGGPIASVTTDENGAYAFPELLAGDYTVMILTPLGYTIASDEVPVTISGGQITNIEFSLTCVDIVPNTRGGGFWKHQVGVATGGNGRAQIDGVTLCGYLDGIEAHFNNNSINEVIVYDPLEGADCSQKLIVAKDLLNLKGNVGMTARAKQQLMALLLNVASEKLSLMDPQFSADGATVSQAITYCDNLIDDPAGDHETAKTIADLINNAKMVPTNMIPLDTENIAYSPAGPEPLPNRLALHQNAPNPFNPTTVIRYDVPVGDGNVSLRIYDVTGSLIRTLVDGTVSPGHKAATWDGKDARGNQVSSGIYFYRLTAGSATFTKKMVFLK